MTPYLRFGLNGARYAIAARAVLEIVRLPELSIADEAPPYIAGLINLRGKIAPVMNLDLRLGHDYRGCQLSDSVILLQLDEVMIGCIVNEVSEVVEIADAQIESPPSYDGAADYVHFLAGNARVGEEIVMLLDVVRLIQAPPLAQSTRPVAPGYFCPEATTEERAIFHSRAHDLMQTVAERDAVERIPAAIIQLGGELFGVGLDVIREFVHLRRVTPVPCCPPHIMGNMNLRGDILTLVDLRASLGIPASAACGDVMVVETGDLYVGVPVEQVFEVVYLRSADIAPMPAASHAVVSEYATGVAHHGAGLVTMLDMGKILARSELEVVEEV